MTRAELDPSVLEALKRFDSPTLSNAIETFAIRPRDEGYMSMDIRCMFPELGPMVGYAATATIRARGPVQGDQTPLYQHVRDVPGPRVVVVQDLDDPPGCGSLWGEVNATIFGALGCAGCVTDGCDRGWSARQSCRPHPRRPAWCAVDPPRCRGRAAGGGRASHQCRANPAGVGALIGFRRRRADRETPGEALVEIPTHI